MLCASFPKVIWRVSGRISSRISGPWVWRSCRWAVRRRAKRAFPALLKPLIDQGFGAHGPVQSLPWLIPLAVVGLALTRGAMQYAANYLLAYVSNRVLLDLRRAMFDRLLRARAAFFQRETASALINAVVFEVNQALT